MPRTVEEIEADRARIRARMASGVSLVSAGDMTTRFDNANDVQALALLDAEMTAATGQMPTTRMSFIRVGLRRS